MLKYFTKIFLIKNVIKTPDQRFSKFQRALSIDSQGSYASQIFFLVPSLNQNQKSPFLGHTYVSFFTKLNIKSWCSHSTRNFHIFAINNDVIEITEQKMENPVNSNYSLERCTMADTSAQVFHTKYWGKKALTFVNKHCRARANLYVCSSRTPLINL